MDQNEMAELFSKLLKQLEISNNALATHSDALVENAQTMRNLEKVCSALGSVLAQGLSANANGALLKEALGIFGRFIAK